MLQCVLVSFFVFGTSAQKNVKCKIEANSGIWILFLKRQTEKTSFGTSLKTTCTE